MPIALYGSDAQTYPPPPAEKLSALTADLERALPKNPALIAGDDPYVRLADIVVAWSVFRHFYPYFDVVRPDWQAALREVVAALRPA